MNDIDLLFIILPNVTFITLIYIKNEKCVGFSMKLIKFTYVKGIGV